MWPTILGEIDFGGLSFRESNFSDIFLMKGPNVDGMNEVRWQNLLMDICDDVHEMWAEHV